MLDNLINIAFLKIFKVPEKLVIRDIRHFLGLHDVLQLLTRSLISCVLF